MTDTDSRRSIIRYAADQGNIFIAKETPFLDTGINAGDLSHAAWSMAYLSHLLKVFEISLWRFFIIVAACPTCRGNVVLERSFCMSRAKGAKGAKGNRQKVVDRNHVYISIFN